MKETIKEINNGYKEAIITPDNYIFGFGQINDDVINETGDWKPYLPPEEFQNEQGFENYGCVTWTTLNVLEVLARKLFKEEWDKSERYTYIASETNPADFGNDPHKVAESVRKLGVLNEEELPFNETIKTLEEFNSPKPLPKNLLSKASFFLDDFEYKHEWVSPNTLEISKAVLKEALKRSPIGLAVYAWGERGGKYFRPEGGQDTHLTLLVNINKEGCMEVFDSYSPAIKVLEKDFPVYTAKRYFLRKKTEAEKEAEKQGAFNLLQLALNWLKAILGLIKIPKPIERIPPPIDSVPIEEIPKVSRIEDWARAIEKFENAAKWRNNPGAIRSLQGTFLRFDSYEEGFDYLCDYLKRACRGEHKSYKPDFTLLQFLKFMHQAMMVIHHKIILAL